MTKLKLFFAKIKDRLKEGDKKPLILTGIIAGFVLLAIGALIATIYLTGSNLGEFFSKYYAWFLLALAGLIVIICTIIYTRLRKGR